MIGTLVEWTLVMYATEMGDNFADALESKDYYR
jgi:hypothetical protein